MFLSITTTHEPATDLGYLLHKNPARIHEVELPFGKAITFYPEASAQRCTAALVLDIDPVGLVRGRGNASGLMDEYVNDRPYAASSFLAVGLGRAWREAIAGHSKERQALADTAIPLEADITPLPARGGAGLVTELFAPLGYEVECRPIPIDPIRTDWGESPYVALKLRATKQLSELLTHLYVLIPVLDDRKHYFVGENELQKLLSKGDPWLAAHPAKPLIVNRYLTGRRTLVKSALEQLSGYEEDTVESDSDINRRDEAEATIEQPLRLHELRLKTVARRLKDAGAHRVLDLGCGEGKLITHLMEDADFREIVGVEVSSRALERAERKLSRFAPLQRARVILLQGALIYRDQRLRGYDAAALVEVIEHIEPDRLDHLEMSVFGDARPTTVIVTTPNADYNSLFSSLPQGQFRHVDHRFEWGRAAFADWCARVGEAYGYRWSIEPLGPVDESLGAPSQMGVFSR